MRKYGEVQLAQAENVGRSLVLAALNGGKGSISFAALTKGAGAITLAEAEQAVYARWDYQARKGKSRDSLQALLRAGKVFTIEADAKSQAVKVELK